MIHYGSETPANISAYGEAHRYIAYIIGRWLGIHGQETWLYMLYMLDCRNVKASLRGLEPQGNTSIQVSRVHTEVRMKGVPMHSTGGVWELNWVS